MNISQDRRNLLDCLDEELRTRFLPDLTSAADCDEVPRPTQTTRRKMRPEVAAIMGEANRRYFAEDYERAVALCKEVVKGAPYAPDPFRLMAEIYDDMGQGEASLQHSLVAAHLSKSVDDWLAVADRCLELGRRDLRLFCYERACRLESTDEQLWLQRCRLMEEAGADRKKILECCCHVLHLKGPNDGESYVNLARYVFEGYMSLDENAKARETMLRAVDLHPRLTSERDVNRLLDLFFLDGDYSAALDLLFKHSGVVLVDDDPQDVRGLVLTQDLHVDLKAKLLVSLIRSGKSNATESVLRSLTGEDCDDVGDLYLDVAEAFMSEDAYDRAEPLLARLVGSRTYNLAAVWLRRGECLESMRRYPEAVEAFETVVEMAPDHADARIRLSNLHQLLGHAEKAVRVLSGGKEETARLGSGDSVALPSAHRLQLAVSRCLVFHRQGDVSRFVAEASDTLTLCCEQLFVSSSARLSEMLNARPYGIRQFVYRKIAEDLKLRFDRSPPEIPDLVSRADDIWELYLKLFELLHRLKRYEELDKMSAMMILCPAFLNDARRTAELEFLCVISGLVNRDSSIAYSILRAHLLKEPCDVRAWNLFGQVTAPRQDLRHNRFCIRQAVKHPENTSLWLLNGHNALVAGSYKYALGEYFACLKRDPRNPFYHFVVGVALINVSSQRFCSHRHRVFIHACAFLNQYLKLRGECQESYYNLGRAMHQLGLTYLAVSYYQKALECPPSIPDDPAFDLTKEIAFNLYVVYGSVKSYDMAAYVAAKCLRVE